MLLSLEMNSVLNCRLWGFSNDRESRMKLTWPMVHRKSRNCSDIDSLLCICIVEQYSLPKRSNYNIGPFGISGERQKLFVVLLGFKRSLSEDRFNLLMVQTLLLEHLFRQFFNFISVKLNLSLSQRSTLLNHPNHLFVNYRACFLTEYVLAIGLDWRIVGKGITHSEPRHHCSCQVSHLHQIIGRTIRTLTKCISTSLKKCYSDIRPPRITQIWSINCLLFIKVDSLGKY